jgi:hypothetical protein
LAGRSISARDGSRPRGEEIWPGSRGADRSLHRRAAGRLGCHPRSARQSSRFQYLSGKRRIRVDVPEDSEVTRWLGHTPDTPPSGPRRGRKVKAGEQPVATTTLVYSIAGRPYTKDGLSLELRSSWEPCTRLRSSTATATTSGTPGAWNWPWLAAATPRAPQCCGTVAPRASSSSGGKPIESGCPTQRLRMSPRFANRAETKSANRGESANRTPGNEKGPGQPRSFQGLAMVPPSRIERETSRATIWRSNQLS